MIKRKLKRRTSRNPVIEEYGKAVQKGREIVDKAHKLKKGNTLLTAQ